MDIVTQTVDKGSHGGALEVFVLLVFCRLKRARLLARPHANHEWHRLQLCFSNPTRKKCANLPNPIGYPDDRPEIQAQA